MFKVISIFENNYHLTNQTKILEYCKHAYSEKTEPSHVNMYSEKWDRDVAVFPYLIYCSDRFRNNQGDMFVLLDNNDNICALSGINISEFDNFVALGGVRTWLNKEFRGKFVVGRYLLPAQLQWAKTNNLKTVALTFNDYNRRLVSCFKRSGFGIAKKRNIDSMFYNGHHYVDFPVNINYTKQWVVYHKIDELYEPIWDKIRHDK
jgi:hypothetical protein